MKDYRLTPQEWHEHRFWVTRYAMLKAATDALIERLKAPLVVVPCDEPLPF